MDSAAALFSFCAGVLSASLGGGGMLLGHGLLLVTVPLVPALLAIKTCALIGDACAWFALSGSNRDSLTIEPSVRRGSWFVPAAYALYVGIIGWGAGGLLLAFHRFFGDGDRQAQLCRGKGIACLVNLVATLVLLLMFNHAYPSPQHLEQLLPRLLPFVVGCIVGALGLRLVVHRTAILNGIPAGSGCVKPADGSHRSRSAASW